MPNYYSIVPAAGSGSRMGADCPKQYLPLLGHPLLWHTLHALGQVGEIREICVVLSPADEWWETFDWHDLGDRITVLRVGGDTRAQSVSNALAQLAGRAGEDDWVLVHDAARPCLDPDHVRNMMSALRDNPVGGLLAVPLADTLKQADDANRVMRTLPRTGLWQAQTPQMFRYGLLSRALEHCQDVTDEAGAVEASGLSPQLVAASTTNFKVTYPQDLALAAQILQARRAT